MVLIGAGALLLLLAGVWVLEGSRKEWKKVQKAYERILKEAGEDGSRALEKGIFQVDLRLRPHDRAPLVPDARRRVHGDDGPRRPPALPTL